MTGSCFSGINMPCHTSSHTEKLSLLFQNRVFRIFLEKTWSTYPLKNFCSYRHYFLIEIHASCTGDINNLLLSKGYVLGNMKEENRRYFSPFMKIHLHYLQINFNTLYKIFLDFHVLFEERKVHGKPHAVSAMEPIRQAPSHIYDSI